MTFNGSTINETAGFSSASLVRDPDYDEVVFIIGYDMMLQYSVWKLDANGISKIANYSGSMSSFTTNGGKIAWYGYMSSPYNLYFYNGDSTKMVASSNYSFSGVDLFNNTLTWSQSDGHDAEIYYYNGSSMVRVTSNNGEDNYAKVVQDGVVFSGTTESGVTGWIFWNGTTSRLFSSTYYNYPLTRFGDDLLCYYGYSMSSMNSPIYRISF